MSENELGCVERPPFFYFYQLRCTVLFDHDPALWYKTGNTSVPGIPFPVLYNIKIVL